MKNEITATLTINGKTKPVKFTGIFTDSQLREVINKFAAGLPPTKVDLGREVK